MGPTRTTDSAGCDAQLARAWRTLFDAVDAPLSEANRETAEELGRDLDQRSLLPVALGETLGAYRVESVLGVGGQAVVYLGRHALVNRTAALKVPLRDVSDRLMVEARSLADLNHPHIVRMEDVVLQESRAFLVLEHLKGGSLADLLEQHPKGLPEERVLGIARSVAEALSWAHAKGVVHLDLKPQNVLFDEHGNCKVTDFGIGKSLGEVLIRSLSRGTRTGGLGTPLYLAPEQAMPELLAPGERLDGRADLYSLGKLLYHMLTGRQPLAVLPLSHVRPDCQPGWEKLIFQLLEEDRARRVESATAVECRLGEIALELARAQSAVFVEEAAAEISQAGEAAPVQSRTAPRVQPFHSLGRYFFLPSMIFAFAGLSLPVGSLDSFYGSSLLVQTGLIFGSMLALAVLLEWAATRQVRVLSLSSQAGLLVLTAGVGLFAFGFGDVGFRMEGGAYWALAVGLPLLVLGLLVLCMKMFLSHDLQRMLASDSPEAASAGSAGLFHLAVLAGGVALVAIAFFQGGDLEPYSAGSPRANAIKQVLLSVGWTLFGLGLFLTNSWGIERRLRGKVRVFSAALGGALLLLALSVALLASGLGWTEVIRHLSGPSWALGIGLPLLINAVGLLSFQLLKLLHPRLERPPASPGGTSSRPSPIERARAWLLGEAAPDRSSQD